MSATTKTSLCTVINQVTKEKLAWLDCQGQKLKAHFQPILDKYENPENRASLQFLREIHAALKSCTDSENPALDKTKDLTVLLNWINLDEPDQLIYFGSEQLVHHWIDVLVRKIKFQIERCEYSCLYANVMKQYMDSNSGPQCDEEMMEVDTPSSGGNQLSEKAKQFSENIFKEPSIQEFDKEKFDHFLNNELFDINDPTQKHVLLKTRNYMKQFCKTFHLNSNLSTLGVQLTIDGLLSEDLLDAPEKVVTLKRLKENEDALKEVTSLLTHRLENFATWQWLEPVWVDFHRNRAYMDEDIITALFLHYVGARWAIKVKQLFKDIYLSKMWKRGTGTLGDLYYTANSVEGFRRYFHGKSFLSSLPSRMQDLAITGYDDDNSPNKIQQKLLHFISNEIQLNQILRPEMGLTVVQTALEWFEPSIPHEAICSIMKFFGVTEEWQAFFRKFLECPLRVDKPSAPGQIRKRGVPVSHTLSTLFGESLLFVMDLYVNQQSALSIYRIHDQFWFWGHDQSKVGKAWEGIQAFVKMSGLKINDEKSASVICQYEGDKEEAPKIYQFGGEPLPQRKVKWGFLVLHSDGMFRINNELLEPHVLEMRKSLQMQETVLGWVQGHNRYIKFFLRNFVQPAICFGQQHIAQIIKALQGILLVVHKEAKGDTVKALKYKFAEIWKNKEIMDAWVHWPVLEGGLGLNNPFLEFIPLYEAYRMDEEDLAEAGYYENKFGTLIDHDKKEWSRLLDKSKKRRKRRANAAEDDEIEDEETITDLESEDDDSEYGREVERCIDRGMGKDKRSKRGLSADIDVDSENENDDLETSDNENLERGISDSDNESLERGISDSEVEMCHESSREKATSAKSSGKDENIKGSKRLKRQEWQDRYRETRWSHWTMVYHRLLETLKAKVPHVGGNWIECMYNSQLCDKLGDGGGFIDKNMIPLSLIGSVEKSLPLKD